MKRHAAQSDTSRLNDRDLLRRFIQDSDDQAFAEIVRRYQGLVMGICRRVMGDSPEVDDAFQATFITLARRPRQIRRCPSLSSWLYTVAWRTSLRQVRQCGRHTVEPLVDEPQDRSDPGPLDLIARSQEQTILDEELNHLPDRYRDVLVMTYFAGQNSQQIADQFNVSKGIVDGRIRQARNMLRVRLARRGVAIGVLVTAAGLSSANATAASASLINSTIHLGTQTLTGSLSGSSALPHLEPLIRPEIAMLSSKQILIGALCLSAIATTAAMSGLASGQTDGDPFAPDLKASITESEVQPTDSAAAVAVGVGTGGNRVTESDMAIDRTSSPGAGGSRFKTYPSDAKPIERWMYEVLDEPVVLSHPGPEVPLKLVLSDLADQINKEYGRAADGTQFQLQFWPDYTAFSDEGISAQDPLEEFYVRGIEVKGMSARSALKLILEQTTEQTELTYVIQDEVMMITTLDRAESDDLLFTRVYEADDLLDLDFGESYSQTMGGGSGFMAVVPEQFGGASNNQASGQKQKSRRGKSRNKDGNNSATIEQEASEDMIGFQSGFGGMGGGLGSGIDSMYPTEPITLAAVVMDMTSPPVLVGRNERRRRHDTYCWSHPRRPADSPRASGGRPIAQSAE